MLIRLSKEEATAGETRGIGLGTAEISSASGVWRDRPIEYLNIVYVFNEVPFVRPKFVSPTLGEKEGEVVKGSGLTI